MPEDNREKKGEQKPFRWRSFVLQSASKGGVAQEVVAIAVVVIVVILVWFCYGWQDSDDHHSRERARRIYCMNNVKQIAIGLILYTDDHDEAFPPDLQTLYNKYVVTDTSIFVCGSSGKLKAMNVAPTDYATGKSANIPGTNMSYCYVAGLKSTDPENYILVFEEESNHNGDGIMVLYMNQDVVWETDINAVHQKLVEQEQELKAQGREMRIIRPGESDKK
jgi:hypothetical protein